MMKKILATIVLVLIGQIALQANDYQYITTNKTAYVIGEQVLFDVTKFKSTDSMTMVESDSIITMDLVAPNGQIVKTKSLIKEEKGNYFFSLADTLETGIYRLIANSSGANQSIKRIHVYALELEELVQRKAVKIEAQIQGGELIKGQSNKVAVRATDKNGSGMVTKGTLVNSVDSLVQYLDTDANGVVSFNFVPNDSLYQIRFGDKILKLMPKTQSIHCQIQDEDDRITINLVKVSEYDGPINISINGVSHGQTEFSNEQDTLRYDISKENMIYGIHSIVIEPNKGLKRKFDVLVKPSSSVALDLKLKAIENNEEFEFSLEDTGEEIEYLNVSVVDEKYSAQVNFYEELFFDQAGLDLQLVDTRDFEAYVMLFREFIERMSNKGRLAASGSRGVLNYKSEYPYDEISILNLTSMKVMDVRNENILGIHDFEAMVGEPTQVFPYHFTTYLQPIERADFDEVADYSYPPLSSSLSFGKTEVEMVKSYDIQKNIVMTYKPSEKEQSVLPKPDYVYELEQYDVPNTMIDMINYIVKYVSVSNNKEGKPELSMYRYMSTYKYRGMPLVFLNNLPIYDVQTVLNLNPKDFAKVEVRNSYQANSHLGNFSLNGSVSFYLKEGIENPLKQAYANLPVLESCQNFNKRATENEFAPDFRHQLYWNPNLTKTKDSFWVDLKSSDLSATYDVLITAFMKDGNVVQSKSQLEVK